MDLNSENTMNRQEFWTGLYNPQYRECYDTGCVNKLKWLSDGSYLLSWPDPSHELHFNGRDYCGRYKNDKIDDKDCNRNYYYICEFKCPATTTTTTTTTTSTTTTTTTGKICVSVCLLSSFLKSQRSQCVH